MSAHQAGAETISVLSIASSLETDSGNYTCSLPNTGLARTKQILIQQASTRVGNSLVILTKTRPEGLNMRQSRFTFV